MVIAKPWKNTLYPYRRLDINAQITNRTEPERQRLREHADVNVPATFAHCRPIWLTRRKGVPRVPKPHDMTIYVDSETQAIVSRCVPGIFKHFYLLLREMKAQFWSGFARAV